ncbi:MAG: hypothetical protein ABIZ91_20570, partial [Gemmatimonadaceae bacterium]
MGVIGDRIFAAGGIDPTGAASRALFVYSAKGGWKLSPDSLPFPAACGNGGAVVEGKLYVWAGEPDVSHDFCEVSRTLAVYDPNKPNPPRWTILQAAPPEASWACYFSMAALGSTIHFVGGIGCGFEWNGYQHSYNTKTAQWVPAPRLPLTYWPAAVAISGRLLTLGGWHGNEYLFFTAREVWSYDPEASGMDVLAPMLIGRTNHAATVLGRRVIVVGGINDGTGEVTGSAEALTIVTGCDIHEPDGTAGTATSWRLMEDGQITD